MRYPFPEALGRNLGRVQMVVIEIDRGAWWSPSLVETPDPTSEGSWKAYAKQMATLCVHLKCIERIQHLHIAARKLTLGFFLDEYLKIMKPLLTLSNVGVVSWDSGVTDTVGKALQKRIGDS